MIAKPGDQPKNVPSRCRRGAAPPRDLDLI
jgi:hypothetical protein